MKKIGNNYAFIDSQNQHTKPPIKMGGFVPFISAWRIVARAVSMPRRLWCSEGLATTSFHLYFKRVPCSDRTFSESDYGDTTTDVVDILP